MFNYDNDRCALSCAAFGLYNVLDLRPDEGDSYLTASNTMLFCGYDTMPTAVCLYIKRRVFDIHIKRRVFDIHFSLLLDPTEP